MANQKGRLWEICKAALDIASLLGAGGGALSGSIASWFGANLWVAIIIGLLTFLALAVVVIWRQHYRLIQTGIVARRNEIERVYPLREQYSNRHVIRACFLTGLDGFQRFRDVLKADKIIEQIILPNPTCGYLRDLQQSQGDASGSLDFARDIKEVSKMAIEREIEVRWYPHFCGLSFLIGREKSTGKQWAHIETVLPYMPPPERLIIRLDTKSNDEAVEELSKAFTAMWKFCGTNIASSDLK